MVPGIQYKRGNILSKFNLKTLPALIVAITLALVTQSVYGVTDHQLVFTENSSTDLLVTYDGTVVPTSSLGLTDFWIVSVPVNLGLSGFNLAWFEPDNSY